MLSITTTTATTTTTTTTTTITTIAALSDATIAFNSRSQCLLVLATAVLNFPAGCLLLFADGDPFMALKVQAFDRRVLTSQ